MGTSGITTYVIIINKCEGVLEIIGLSLIFEYCIIFKKRQCEMIGMIEI